MPNISASACSVEWELKQYALFLHLKCVVGLVQCIARESKPKAGVDFSMVCLALVLQGGLAHWEHPRLGLSTRAKPVSNWGGWTALDPRVLHWAPSGILPSFAAPWQVLVSWSFSHMPVLFIHLHGHASPFKALALESLSCPGVGRGKPENQGAPQKTWIKDMNWVFFLCICFSALLWTFLGHIPARTRWIITSYSQFLSLSVWESPRKMERHSCSLCIHHN